MPEKRFDMVGRKAGWEAQVARGEEEGALRDGRRGTRSGGMTGGVAQGPDGKWTRRYRRASGRGYSERA